MNDQPAAAWDHPSVEPRNKGIAVATFDPDDATAESGELTDDQLLVLRRE